MFDRRSLTPLFDGGIYGSPLEKKDIIKMLFASNCIVRPVLFLGDSADWVEAELRIAYANSEIRRIGSTDRGDHEKGNNHRTLFAVTKPRGSA